MTFLAPGYLFGAFAVAAGIALLHFIVTRQPRSLILPTARFVPESPVTATSRAARPSDLWLMVLRVLVVLAAGGALARPVMLPSRTSVGRVIIADVSRGVGDFRQVADSLASIADEGAPVIVFDSTAHRINGVAADSVSRIPASGARGNLSVGLIAALRAAGDMRDRFDSLELVVVSPLTGEEWDAATAEIRALWPGRARLVRVSSRVVEPVRKPALHLASDESDPLSVTSELIGSSAGTVPVRVLRGQTPALRDTMSGETVVSWPSSSRPPRAIPRARMDTANAVVTRSAVVIATFERSWMYPDDSLRGATVVARWADGEPAAIQIAGPPARCVTSVAIPVAGSGDLVIRPEFVRLVNDLTSVCGDSPPTIPLDPAKLAVLQGGRSLAAASAFPPRRDQPSPLAPWLIALALAGAVIELFVREGRRRRGAEIIGRGDQGEVRAA